MQRYFVDDQSMNKELLEATISGDDARHISKVMRSVPGDSLICCNEQGVCYLARIKQIEQGKVTCQLEEELEDDRELPVSVIVAQSLPKGDKMEWVIQKGTELGASSFAPFISSRSIVRLDGAKEQRRLERWRKIAKEAAEQSHRNKMPRVESIHSWEQALTLGRSVDLALFAYEKEKDSSSLYDKLGEISGNRTILLMIGPEGGFSEREVEDAIAAGFEPVSLGKRILRTETASLYGLSNISFYYEQMKAMESI